MGFFSGSILLLILILILFVLFIIIIIIMATRSRSTSSSGSSSGSLSGYSLFSCHLTIEQLDDVIELLKKCGFPAIRWHDLGLKLGLHKNTLDAIEVNHRDNVHRCLEECLAQWLRRADNVDNKGGAAYNSLSDALRLMDLIDVADKLKINVAIGVFENHYSFLSQSLADPVNVARVLYGERLITELVMTNVESARPSISNQRKVLLAAIKEAIKIDYSLLQTFAIVLCKFTVNVKIGAAIFEDYNKYFPDDFVKIKVDGVEIPIHKSMSEDFSSIRASYGQMIYDVRKAIKNSNVDLEELKDFIISCNSDLKEEVAGCTDVSSVLRVIERNECSLIDIQLISAVVEEFKVEEAEKYIKEYKEKLKESCRKMSEDLFCKEKFSNLGSSPSLQCETVTYVFDWQPDEKKLEDITDILSKVSGKFVKLKFINTGKSIIVTCSFPHFLIGALIINLMENLEILKKNKLKKLMIGYYTVWEVVAVQKKEKALAMTEPSLGFHKDSEMLSLFRKLNLQLMKEKETNKELENILTQIAVLREREKELLQEKIEIVNKELRYMDSAAQKLHVSGILLQWLTNWKQNTSSVITTTSHHATRTEPDSAPFSPFKIVGATNMEESLPYGLSSELSQYITGIEEDNWKISVQAKAHNMLLKSSVCIKSFPATRTMQILEERQAAIEDFEIPVDNAFTFTVTNTNKESYAVTEKAARELFYGPFTSLMLYKESAETIKYENGVLHIILPNDIYEDVRELRNECDHLLARIRAVAFDSNIPFSNVQASVCNSFRGDPVLRERVRNTENTVQMLELLEKIGNTVLNMQSLDALIEAFDDYNEVKEILAKKKAFNLRVHEFTEILSSRILCDSDIDLSQVHSVRCIVEDKEAVKGILIDVSVLVMESFCLNHEIKATVEVPGLVRNYMGIVFGIKGVGAAAGFVSHSLLEQPQEQTDSLGQLPLSLLIFDESPYSQLATVAPLAFYLFTVCTTVCIYFLFISLLRLVIWFVWGTDINEPLFHKTMAMTLKKVFQKLFELFDLLILLLPIIFSVLLWSVLIFLIKEGGPGISSKKRILWFGLIYFMINLIISLWKDQIYFVWNAVHHFLQKLPALLKSLVERSFPFVLILLSLVLLQTDENSHFFFWIFLFMLIIPSVILPSLDLISLSFYRTQKLSLKSVVIIQILVSVTIVPILYLSNLTLKYSPRGYKYLTIILFTVTLLYGFNLAMLYVKIMEHIQGSISYIFSRLFYLHNNQTRPFNDFRRQLENF